MYILDVMNIDKINEGFASEKNGQKFLVLTDLTGSIGLEIKIRFFLFENIFRKRGGVVQDVRLHFCETVVGARHLSVWRTNVNSKNPSAGRQSARVRSSPVTIVGSDRWQWRYVSVDKPVRYGTDVERYTNGRQHKRLVLEWWEIVVIFSFPLRNTNILFSVLRKFQSVKAIGHVIRHSFTECTS